MDLDCSGVFPATALRSVMVAEDEERALDFHEVATA